MTEQDWISWDRSIKIAAKAAKEHYIPVRYIKIHKHLFRNNCDLGLTDTARRTIELCDDQAETALHELAHIWSQANHTEIWVRKLYQLHEEYLEDDEIELYRRETENRYKAAKKMSEDSEQVKKKRKKRRRGNKRIVG